MQKRWQYCYYHLCKFFTNLVNTKDFSLQIFTYRYFSRDTPAEGHTDYMLAFTFQGAKPTSVRTAVGRSCVLTRTFRSTSGSTRVWSRSSVPCVLMLVAARTTSRHTCSGTRPRSRSSAPSVARRTSQRQHCAGTSAVTRTARSSSAPSMYAFSLVFVVFLLTLGLVLVVHTGQCRLSPPGHSNPSHHGHSY